MAENQNNQDLADPAVVPIDHSQGVLTANAAITLKMEEKTSRVLGKPFKGPHQSQ